MLSQFRKLSPNANKANGHLPHLLYALLEHLLGNSHQTQIGGLWYLLEHLFLSASFACAHRKIEPFFRYKLSLSHLLYRVAFSSECPLAVTMHATG